MKNKIALVAGATRGAGRGIACMLGEAGATVYCTGRSTQGRLASGLDRTETIEETAEMVNAYGGKGVAVRTDHSVSEEVEMLIQKIDREQGRLDILVNDIWGGDTLTEWGKPFWEHDLEKGLLMQQRGVFTHLITSHYAVPLMIRTGGGLLVEITDGDNHRYRLNLFYDLAKNATIRLGMSQAQELKDHGITALTLTPGFLRSEAVLESFGVTEDNWQEAIEKDPLMGPFFAHSETPFFIGRAIAALAADPEIWKKSGGLYSSWALSEEYGLTDIDGRRPHWGRYSQAQLDLAWEQFTDTLKQLLKDEKADPSQVLQSDRQDLKVSLRLTGKSAGEDWFTTAFSDGELLLGDPEELAGRFLSRVIKNGGRFKGH